MLDAVAQSWPGMADEFRRNGKIPQLRGCIRKLVKNKSMQSK